MFRIHEMEKQGEHVLEGSGLGGQRVEIGDVSVQAVDCTDQFILRNLETGGGSACAFHGSFRILGEAAETYEPPCPSGDCIQRKHIFRHPGIAGAQNGVASCRFLDLFLTVDTEWSMDDHHPAGFRTDQEPTIYHKAPSPYGIPYRCLYSRDVPNLFFAGRNISVSHAALSSCRVMGTCAMLGQAVGTAASVAAARGCLPRDITEKHITYLQALLMDDDCFLPHLRRRVSPLCAGAALEGDGWGLECLRDGVDRDRAGEAHAWVGGIGSRISYRFAVPGHISRIRLVFDSDLDRSTLPWPENRMNRNMFHNRRLCYVPSHMPATMLKRYRIAARCLDGGSRIVVQEDHNYLRLRKYAVDIADCIELTLEPLETWGSEEVRIFAFEAE